MWKSYFKGFVNLQLHPSIVTGETWFISDGKGSVGRSAAFCGEHLLQEFQQSSEKALPKLEKMKELCPAWYLPLTLRIEEQVFEFWTDLR